jgi:hypothetical protein
MTSKVFEAGAAEIKKQIADGTIQNEQQLESAFEMLDVKVQAELSAMRAETEQLKERATQLTMRIALRDALLSKGVAPRMIKGASAVLYEYIHLTEGGSVTGPDSIPLSDFLDAFLENGEGQVFVNGNSTHHHHHHQPGLMTEIAKNLS